MPVDMSVSFSQSRQAREQAVLSRSTARPGTVRSRPVPLRRVAEAPSPVGPSVRPLPARTPSLARPVTPCHTLLPSGHKLGTSDSRI